MDSNYGDSEKNFMSKMALTKGSGSSTNGRRWPLAANRTKRDLRLRQTVLRVIEASHNHSSLRFCAWVSYSGELASGNCSSAMAGVQGSARTAFRPRHVRTPSVRPHRAVTLRSTEAPELELFRCQRSMGTLPPVNATVAAIVAWMPRSPANPRIETALRL